MQTLHPFVGSARQYINEIADPDRCRPDRCPQCEARRPLTAHGFYSRTSVDGEFGGPTRVRRYLSRCCKRTISLLPEFALPYLRFNVTVIAVFLIARLLGGLHPWRCRAGSQAVRHALPAWPVLGAPFSAPGRKRADADVDANGLSSGQHFCEEER